MEKTGSKQVLCAAVFLFASAFGYAAERDPMAAILERDFPTSHSLDYQLHDSPGSTDSPVVVENNERGEFIVSKTPTDTWSVHERFGQFNLSDPVLIPQTNLLVPTSLWTAEAGAAYGRHLQNGRDAGLSFSVGSDSDKLFNSIHETVFQATADYRIPSGQRNAWLLFLNYSNNRHFLNNIPLPGFAYAIRSADGKLRALVGFPFAAVFYAPSEDWSMRAGLFGPRRLNAEIAYRVVAQARVYGGFDWSPLEWERANRDDNSNRLFFDKKRVMLGVRSPLVEGLSLDVSGGREFDRRFFENDSSSTSGIPYASLPACWYFETRLTFRFGGRN